MGENYNTGTCTIRIGRDYVCLNFGSNLAASASVRDRGTSDRVPGGRACSVTVPNTNCTVNPLPRSFSRGEASINVLRDLPVASRRGHALPEPSVKGCLMHEGAKGYEKKYNILQSGEHPSSWKNMRTNPRPPARPRCSLSLASPP